MSNFKYRTKDDDLKVLHFQVPKALMYEDKYKGLSANAKLLFGMMVDRTSLSLKNNWYDKNDYAFITCSIDEVEVFLGVARGTANKALKDLEKANLIQMCKATETGHDNFKNSNANAYYVGYVETTKQTLQAHLEMHNATVDALIAERAEKTKIRKANMKLRKSGTFKNCTISENTSVQNEEIVEPSNCKDSTKIERRFVQKLNVSNTELSNTDNSMYVCTSDEGTKLSSDLLLELERKSSSKTDPAAWLHKTVEILLENNIYTLEAYKESVKEFGKQFKKVTPPRANTSSQSKNKFRNFEETYDKYSTEEFESIIDKSQHEKFERPIMRNDKDYKLELRKRAIQELQANTIVTVDPTDSYWIDAINKKMNELRHS